MKCRYKFATKAHIRVSMRFPIKFNDLEFDFHTTEKDLLDSIWVTFPCNDTSDWPRVENLTGPVKANIRITHPRRDELVEIVRFLEGMLSFYGMESIEVENPTIEWLPENEQEKSAIGLCSFSSSRGELDFSRLPEMKLSLLAQSLYAYHDAWHMEPLLNFFRKGILAIREERFIEAIYNFYFYLESAYGNGQTRNNKILIEFVRNAELVDAIVKARDTFDLSKHLYRRAIYQRFDSAYRGRDPKQIVRTIVELRGYLHHHSKKRPGIWHPEDKWPFCADAFMLQSIVYNLAFDEVKKYVFNEKVQSMFIEQIKLQEMKSREV